MSQQTINSRIIKTEPINWRELQFIQQENFKEWVNNGAEKLVESILKYQFIAPFMVWQNEGVNYCLDGRHRFLDLEKVSESIQKMREEEASKTRAVIHEQRDILDIIKSLFPNT